MLTGFGRMSLVQRVARQAAGRRRRWSSSTSPNQEHLATLAERVREHVDGFDGVLHAIGFAPASCLGGGFLDAPWDDVATAVQVSAYSLKSLAVATLPLFGEAGGSIVGLDLRRPRRLAGLRLDGRRQGRARVDLALPRPRARPAARSGST